MARIQCPKCSHRFKVSHSAFVTGREDTGGTLNVKNYHPDPTKKYKTPEKTRRTSLAYYWRNKAAVLAREKRRREKQPAIHVSIA